VNDAAKYANRGRWAELPGSIRDAADGLALMRAADPFAWLEAIEAGDE
jgi:hypothetical protein